MDDDLIINFPWIELRWCPLGDEPIALDTASSWIEASDDYLASEKIVAEPYLIFGQEPMRVMGYVELAICIAWGGRSDANARHVFLHVSLPR